MNNQTDNSQSESRPAGTGIGERLQAARIQQGLSAEDIASRMHLSVQIVKSIEENNFDEITAPIFVKGYLRAYARIVSLDEEEMIQQYASYYSHDDPPITTTSNMAPELSVADMRIKWTTYLVIAGLAALLAAWWWNKSQDESMPISLDSQSGSTLEQTDAAGGGDVPAAQADSAGDSESMTAITSVDEAQQQTPGGAATAEPAAAPEPAIAQPATETGVPQAAVDSASETPADTAVVVEEAVPAAPESVASEVTAPQAAAAEAEAPEAAAFEASAPEASAPEATPSEPAAESEPAPIRLRNPVLVAPTGSDKLSLAISADTWADISDGNDFQMVYHLLRAGQSLELTGSAPFSVFLGNGPGVEIRINGEPVDFSARIRSDNTTRLKIGD